MPEDLDQLYGEALARSYARNAGANCEEITDADLGVVLGHVDKLAANGRLPPEYARSLTRAETRFQSLKSRGLEAEMALEKMRRYVSTLEKHLVSLYAPVGMPIFDYWQQSPGNLRTTYENLRAARRIVRAYNSILWLAQEVTDLTVDGLVLDLTGFVADAEIFNEKLKHVERLPDGIVPIETDLSKYPILPSNGRKVMAHGFMVNSLFDDIVKKAAERETPWREIL